MDFPSDYVTARRNFRDAAASVGWIASQHSVGAAGPTGEDLTIDVAMSPPQQSGRVLVVSSGLHGVEGPLGSAVQIALMERWARGGWPDEVRCVLLHALNPYGFAWSRRFDGDNIDPNRNFLPEGFQCLEDTETYARFDRLLNPRRGSSRWDLFYPRALLAVAVHGVPSLKEALVTGQHDFPKGLFFAGKGPSRTYEMLRRHMKSWIGEAAMVAHLDFHTGLGRWGTCKLLVDHPLNPMQRERLVGWFSPGSFEENDPQGVAYHARGTLGQWCAGQNFAADYVFAFAEFGTYGNLSVIAGLRAENQAHHWGRPGDTGTMRAKARLCELFCPRSAAWRSRALAGGLDIVERAANGLASGCLESRGQESLRYNT